MKKMSFSVPSNINQLAGITGLVMVALTTLGMDAFWPSWAIPVVGAFLGFFAVSDSKSFLLAGLALIGAKWGMARVPVFGSLVQDFAQHLITLVAPAMLIVAIRSIYNELKR